MTATALVVLAVDALATLRIVRHRHHHRQLQQRLHLITHINTHYPQGHTCVAHSLPCQSCSRAS